MPAGLQIWDAAGNPTLLVTDRIARLFGSIGTGTSNGAISVPDFNQGSPFFVVIPSALGAANGIRGMPTVTVSGTTLSWSFAYSYRVACTIYYGSY